MVFATQRRVVQATLVFYLAANSSVFALVSRRFASLKQSRTLQNPSSSHHKKIQTPSAMPNNIVLSSTMKETDTKPTISPKITATNMVESIVGFGGSAAPVPNPNKMILGGKGLGLQEMSSIGINVPPGFTLTTPLCQIYQQSGDLSDEIWAGVDKAIERLEVDMDRKFGDPSYPLLLSCRSGAAVSMPGMMDTVLNVVSRQQRHAVEKKTTKCRSLFYLTNCTALLITGPQQGYCGRPCHCDG